MASRKDDLITKNAIKLSQKGKSLNEISIINKRLRKMTIPEIEYLLKGWKF